MEKKNQTYQIELTLPYPNARYNVSVWARSTVADPNDPRFWSTPSFAIFSTLPDSKKEHLICLFELSLSYLIFHRTLRPTGSEYYKFRGSQCPSGTAIHHYPLVSIAAILREWASIRLQDCIARRAG